jgi:hypothetical protein
MDKYLGRDWKDFISDEKVLKTFTTDIETAAYIKMIMQQYDFPDQNYAIDTLVNLGLVYLGYKNKDDVLKHISLKEKETPNLPMKNSEKKQTFNVMAFSHSNDSIDEQIAAIISSLCKQSSDGYASREDIIKEGESKLISAVNIVGSIDNLKRNGIIYEPIVNQYKNTKDLEMI